MPATQSDFSTFHDRLDPMRQRRLAFVISSMSRPGGIQRVVANLANDMVQDHHVAVICGTGPETSFFPLDPRVQVECLGMSEDQGRRWAKVPWISRCASRLRQRFRHLGTEIALGIWTDYACLLPLAAGRGVRTIACEHIAFEDCAGFWNRARPVLYRRCDAVASLTAADAPRYARFNQRTVVIPNAVTALPGDPAPLDGNRILAIGHFIPRKGFDRLVWAFRYVADRFPDWKIQIVSGGSNAHVDWGYFDYFHTVVTALNLQDRVNITPTTRNITELYRQASIYAMTSSREGLPMVLLEAKAFGLPIVSFDCPTGPREIVRDGIDGFLVGSDIELFAEALGQLMASHERRAAFGRAARQDVEERFSAPQVKSLWYKLFDEVCPAD